MIAALRLHSWGRVVQQLRPVYCFDVHGLVECLVRCCVEILGDVLNALVKIFGDFGEEILLGPTLAVIRI